MIIINNSYLIIENLDLYIKINVVFKKNDVSILLFICLNKF